MMFIFIAQHLVLSTSYAASFPPASFDHLQLHTASNQNWQCMGMVWERAIILQSVEILPWGLGLILSLLLLHFYLPEPKPQLWYATCMYVHSQIVNSHNC